MFRNSFRGAVRAIAQVRPPFECQEALRLLARLVRLASLAVGLLPLDVLPPGPPCLRELLRRDPVEVRAVADHAREPYRFAGRRAPPIPKSIGNWWSQFPKTPGGARR